MNAEGVKRHTGSGQADAMKPQQISPLLPKEALTNYRVLSQHIILQVELHLENFNTSR